MNTQTNPKSIFLQALELPEAERADFIVTACGSDAALRERVESLLKAHHPADSFLDPGKLNPSSGNTQTSDFSDTSVRGERSSRNDNPLAPWLTVSMQPGSLGRFRHYEVLEELGQGGFGIVYRVFDEKLHRVVALKVLSPTLANHASARQRFIREARAVAAVRHEHVVSIHEVEEDPIPHLVMEYIHGKTLQQKIEHDGALRLKEILRIGMQIAQGLAAAHKQGLIHRDIKPSNILLENGIERVKISDFGLAQAVDDASVSQQGQIVGTPAFMSPEQADGKPVDARSDIFSLGSTLYAMCTGSSPFQANTTLATLKKVSEHQPEPVSTVNRELPGWIDGIVSKLMAKEPNERFQTSAEVAEYLIAALSEVQGPAAVSPIRKKFLRDQLIAAIIVIASLLAFTEFTGLTHIASFVSRPFQHQLNLELPDLDTIVHLMETVDTVDEYPTKHTTFSSYLNGPVEIVAYKMKHEIKLLPGNYWLFASRHGKLIHRQLISVGWGGSSSITITIPGTKELNSSVVPPQSNPPSKLNELVRLAAEAKDVAEKRYQAGLIAHDNVLLSNIKWLEARLELALSRQNSVEASECLQKILTEQEARISFCQKQIAAGVISESALISLKEDVVKTNQRLEKLINKP
ncbi:MAG: protein kinase [Planctomycetia bacterium]|nr:protein kinase [Planctomycetia bacterium]